MQLHTLFVSVADLARIVAYYTRAIGLRVLEHGTGRALLGIDEPLPELKAGAAQPSGPRHIGLYHLALLLGRTDLGRFVQHLIQV